MDFSQVVQGSQTSPHSDVAGLYSAPQVLPVEKKIADAVSASPVVSESSSAQGESTKYNLVLQMYGNIC